MSAIIVMTPVVIAAWPVISAAVVGAVGAMGYAAVASSIEQETETKNSINLEIANSDVAAENMSREEELLFSKGDINLSIKKDIRGKLKICVTGKNHSDAELTRIGTEISQKITQQFIYNRVISELKSSDFSIIDQEVGEDETIKIQVRNWK